MSSKVRSFVRSLKSEAAARGLEISADVVKLIEVNVRDFYDADAQIKKEGVTFINYRGDVAIHPAFKVRKDCFDRILQTLKAYGFTKSNGNETAEPSLLEEFMLQ